MTVSSTSLPPSNVPMSPSPTGATNDQASEPVTLTVLGSGAWGSVLSSLGTLNCHNVRVWSRHNETDLRDAIQAIDLLVVAVSMKGVPTVAQQIQDIGLPQQTVIVTATKGLDPATQRTPSQIWQAMFPDHPIVVLSGPNLAKEIEQDLPAATVAASHVPWASEMVQRVFASETFRVYTNTDPLGTELGGTLKNVIAIAVGVCDGLNLGTNAKAALITRALPEILRVGTCLGARPETFWGLSGLGDMLATCSSALSRNYRVGYGLAQGKTLDQILTELNSTAEGINTAHVLIDLANQHGFAVPISREVHRLLNNVITPEEAVEALMARDLKPEACQLF
ncbi:MAG: NAD(P)H-dependent glycerol-3-phosphate dehydrogenase [Leptolyngbyaceae bacterium]|nr:NAD(P)H-dependent glycerol-3-phosphate dehydrogenase [Leptolyngbyaceae bacterium]